MKCRIISSLLLGILTGLKTCVYNELKVVRQSIMKEDGYFTSLSQLDIGAPLSHTKVGTKGS